MKLFVAKGYHLANLPLPGRLVYSVFLVFVGVGIWTSWAIYAERIGADSEGPPGQPSVAERYLERAAAADGSDAAEDLAVGPQDGPSLDLPGDDLEADLGDADADVAAPAAISDLKWPWILDVFHQHLFSVGIVYLILAHLFMLTRLHPVLASVVILLAGVASLLHVLAPVIIHTTGGWLWLMPVTGATMGLTWAGMALWTLAAMWFGLGLDGPRSVAT